MKLVPVIFFCGSVKKAAHHCPGRKLHKTIIADHINNASLKWEET